MLLGVDENVGRVLDFHDEQGLAEDTIVVYSSDNGFFLGHHGLFDKRLMYEPAIRVPMLLRWPGGLAAGRVDTRHFALNIAVAPTMLDRKSVVSGKRVSVRVDLGGRRRINKKTTKTKNNNRY